jgi:Tol biopolymer transport system component
MPLSPGTQLGPYEILAPLGSGGMGEVYRARDPRLSREVAIKVLPSAYAGDVERLRRFEQEARAASQLNHPNILAVHDIGTDDDTPYVVVELLEGETLRERLGGIALAPRRAVEYAVQIAHGLAAAHEKGIVHRDLKPENLFLTRDGRLKILDFGLAKLTRPEESEPATTQAPTMAAETGPGVVMGTVGYMSPEQVRGQAADHRSDIFTLGSILYEMLAGRRAFQADSSVETLSAILKEDPPEISQVDSPIPPGLDRIVRHCLEKSPEQRFQSARDLAFDLESLTSMSGASAAVTALPARTSRRLPVPLLASAGIVVALVAGFLIGQQVVPELAPSPIYRQLTYRQGSIFNARFAPDGQTIVYGGAWDGSPVELFSTRPEGPGSRPLGLAADILSISRTGEMAILFDREIVLGWMSRGTLARVSLTGGAPREVMENVQEADWTPDGERLLIVRAVEGRYRLEFPPGEVLVETNGWISNAHFSPDGERVGFISHPAIGDDRGHVAVLELGGEPRRLTPVWSSSSGLAWSPDGKEIWFTAGERGTIRALHAVDLTGTHRVVTRAPANLLLHDIAADGLVLMTRDNGVRGLSGLAPGETEERTLSWLDWSYPDDLSADGTTLLFEEQGEGGGPGYSVYLRGTDGTAPVRLGSGRALALSPDGRWALTRPLDRRGQLVLLPTGAGERRTVDTGSITVLFGVFSSDGEQIFVYGSEEGHEPALYVMDLEDGEPQPITPEGVNPVGVSISSDNRFVTAAILNGPILLYPLDGGEPRPLTGLEPGEIPFAWGPGSRFLYVARPRESSARVFRLDLESGEREFWREIAPTERAGLIDVGPLLLSRDGQSYVYSYRRVLSTLYLAENLR